MHLSIFALASSEWGIARFTTDSFALIALGVLASLPIQLLKEIKKWALDIWRKLQSCFWLKKKLSNIRKS